jgi:hypothetical protein
MLSSETARASRSPKSSMIFSTACSADSNVCYGSLADITTRLRHVRFTPDSGHSSERVGCPKSAISGHRFAVGSTREAVLAAINRSAAAHENGRIGIKKQ